MDEREHKYGDHCPSETDGEELPNISPMSSRVFKSVPVSSTLPRFSDDESSDCELFTKDTKIKAR